jgi:pyruvate kinase
MVRRQRLPELRDSRPDMTNTKIVATLGPASDSTEVIRKLFEAGVDVFRLNASHGTHEEHGRRIAQVRAIAEELGAHPGILLDLQGPKIRLGTFERGVATLTTGSEFTITTEPVVGNQRIACTSYGEFGNDVKPGDQVLLADGSVELRVIESDGASVRCEVVAGGTVGDRKGINLPGVQVSTPSMTRKDMSDLQFGLDNGIDLVALSFVRKPNDVLRLRLFLEERDAHIPIIAKIEKPEGWQNLDEILVESDGVMVARGDLGVEMALEKVPFIQKSMIERARNQGKFVITATQMLESMVENPFPTRAEVSDVANAIYDGTDAVMLSAETSAGRYPVEAARMMDRIAAEAEQSFRQAGFQEAAHKSHATHAEIIADAAYRAARAAGAVAIIVFTASGSSARLVARYRPPVPIYAFTHSIAVARRLSVVYGVQPVIAPNVKTTDEMMTQMDRILLEQKALKPRDNVVFVAGQPIGRPGSTNLIKLHRIGEVR